MAMTDRQYQAAQLAEKRSQSKDIREIKLLLQDIKEILMMNTYGDCKEGVQMTMDDICKRIVEDAKGDT